MDFREVVRKRRMVRSYDTTPIDDEALDRILWAGLRGPTAGFSQGVDLIVVTDRDLREQVNAIIGPDMDGRRINAPVQIVITADENRYHRNYEQAAEMARAAGQEFTWPAPYWFVDAGAAMMLVLLAAVDEGLDAGFYGHPQHVAALQELLGIPADIVPIGIITLGYRHEDPAMTDMFKRMRGPRRPKREAVHREHWSGGAL